MLKKAGLIVGFGLLFFFLISSAMGLFIRSYLKSKKVILKLINIIRISILKLNFIYYVFKKLVRNSSRQEQVIYSVNNESSTNTSDLCIDYENAIRFSKRISQKTREDQLPSYEEFLTKVST